MHSKLKGNIGQFETASFFAKNGFSVFSENGDLSKIDLIVEKNGKLIRIQCKSVYSDKDGLMSLSLRKCGPNYNYHYKKDDFDYFALYDMTQDKLYLIPSNILTTHTTRFILRINETRQKGNLAEEFLAENQVVKLTCLYQE